MEWKKSKVTRWTANGFTITEDVPNDFRLEACDGVTDFFDTLKEAKAAAALRNELALVKADNERLREQLAQRNGVWPDDANTVTEHDDGRGIPEQRPGGLREHLHDMLG